MLDFLSTPQKRDRKWQRSPNAAVPCTSSHMEIMILGSKSVASNYELICMHYLSYFGIYDENYSA